MSGSFVSADISKISEFITKSDIFVNEFDAIKSEFENINTKLLNSWEGVGATAYEGEVKHILENIGGIKDILDGIKSGPITDIKEQYTKLDNELAEFNKSLSSTEENGG